MEDFKFMIPKLFLTQNNSKCGEEKGFAIDDIDKSFQLLDLGVGDPLDQNLRVVSHIRGSKVGSISFQL
jgi:hypothetical protein